MTIHALADRSLPLFFSPIYGRRAVTMNLPSSAATPSAAAHRLDAGLATRARGAASHKLRILLASASGDSATALHIAFADGLPPQGISRSATPLQVHDIDPNVAPGRAASCTAPKNAHPLLAMPGAARDEIVATLPALPERVVGISPAVADRFRAHPLAAAARAPLRRCAAACATPTQQSPSLRRWFIISRFI